ncbi:MAG: tetratricopeptide repeat protein [Acidobacteriota bacterium]|nr:tetratricopeptide repeat protein [Acidobacteriota bacterium]
MNRGDWIAIASIIVPLLVGLLIFLWRTWHWNKEKELRRIYRRAAMLGESGFICKLRRAYRMVMGKSNQDDEMRRLLLAVVKDKDFWREAVLPGRVKLPEEKERFHQILAEKSDTKQKEKFKQVVETFYDEVIDRLESAESSLWQQRADRERDRISQIEQEVNDTDRIIGINEEQEPFLRKGANPAELDEKQVNLSELLELSLANDTEGALHVAYALSVILDFHGQRNEALEVLRKALNLVLEKGQTADKKLQIRVLNRAANLANKQASCDEAEVFAQKMLELSREIKQNPDVAEALQRLGRSHYFRCDSSLTRELLEESLSIFQKQEPTDLRKIAWAQFDLGMLEVNQNNLPSARDWLEKSLASHLKNDKEADKNGEGTIRVNLAFVLHRQENWKAAHAEMTKAAKLLKGENYFRWYLHFLGRLDIDEGDFDSAQTRFTQSLKIFRDRGDELGIIRSLLGFSFLAAKEGNWEKAVMLFYAEDAIRNEKMNLPFPLDWNIEKEFIERDGYEALGDSAFNVAQEKGRTMTLEQTIESSLA